MRKIDYKINSLRTAKAIGAVYCSESTMKAIENNTLPKGSPFDYAKAAGMLGAKNTQMLIPHCHPVSIDQLNIKFYHYLDEELKEYIQNPKRGMYILVDAGSIGRTGIEIEAITAVSITALTFYDLLKPLGKSELEIGEIKLLEKKGGKSSKPQYPAHIKKAVIIDCTTKGDKKHASAIKKVTELLTENEISITSLEESLSMDDLNEKVTQLSKEEVPLILCIGKTSAKESWAESIESWFHLKLDGVIHAMYNYGYERSALSINSTLTAGIINNSVLITLPGSSVGAEDCLQAILPYVFHPILRKTT